LKTFFATISNVNQTITKRHKTYQNYSNYYYEFKMCDQIECSICMDTIVGVTNKVTTECGHCFHTSCLMANVAHNGFGCPNCRTEMAEAQEESIVTDDFGEDDEDDDEARLPDDDALRGLRLFMDNLDGEEHNPEDELAEQEAIEAENAEDEEAGEDEEKPTPAFIVAKLTQQGVTMEELIKVLLLSHEEYDGVEEFDRLEGELFGKLRIIISNYTPEQEEEDPEEQEEQEEQEETTSQIQEQSTTVVCFDAQPKISMRRMIHV